MARPSGFSAHVKSLALKRSEGACEVGLPGCTVQGQDLQHRRARGAGGSRRPDTNEVSNALVVCRSCHNRIEAREAYADVNGWWLPQWTDGAPTDPKCVRVLWFGSWVFFDDEGGVTYV